MFPKYSKINSYNKFFNMIDTICDDVEELCLESETADKLEDPWQLPENFGYEIFDEFAEVTKQNFDKLRELIKKRELPKTYKDEFYVISAKSGDKKDVPYSVEFLEDTPIQIIKIALAGVRREDINVSNINNIIDVNIDTPIVKNRKIVASKEMDIPESISLVLKLGVELERVFYSNGMLYLALQPSTPKTYTIG